MALGSIRHEICINRSAADVWTLVGDPARVHEWFPGITAASVDGTTRVVTLGTGLSLPEELLVCDTTMRRFQYRITAPLFSFHRGTVDVIELGNAGGNTDSCLVIYATDADPRTMALTISGASSGALRKLKELMEHRTDSFDESRAH